MTMTRAGRLLQRIGWFRKLRPVAAVRKTLSFLAPAVLLLLAANCSTTIPHPPAKIDKEATYSDPVIYPTTDYLVLPGDKLEVTYQFKVNKQKEYRIAVGDQIRVEFYYYSQLDRTLNVRPDGKVTLPYKGDIMAAGLTPSQLARNITRKFSDLLNNPRATVSLVRYGESVRQLKEAIKTAPRGQSRLALVQPDGNISLPLLTPMKVAGKTVGEIQKMVNQAYHPVLNEMFTSVSLYEANGNRFYIFGEVKKPGYYQIGGPLTVTQAVAMAGGLLPTAQHDSVLLITRNEQRRAVGRIINLAKILSTGNMGQDLIVRQADVIFVPKSRLGRLADLGTLIRSFIPYRFSFVYSLTDTVDIIKPNPQ